jgi:vesicle-associated membrane protein 72
MPPSFGVAQASRPGNKIVQVQAQVDAVKGVMQENVEVMLANIDKTEVLENKSAELANQAKAFHKTARATKRHMCRQNAKMNILIACICLVVIIVIIVSLIPSFTAASSAIAPASPSSPAPSP